MYSKLIRSESHELASTPALQADVARTITVYRDAVRALATVVMTHWPELQKAPSKCLAIESLFHPTAKRPVVKYALLSRRLGKMPSYLRRAAIEASYGAVSSYLSNYSNWLDDATRERGSRPPRLGVSNVNPPLYGGNMILIADDWRSVQVKLLGADGQWAFSPMLPVRGRMKRANAKKVLCPSLMLRGKKVLLSCPVDVKRPAFIKDSKVDRVCSVDVGINTAAVAAIVDVSGTVIARKFVSCGRHNDQRDALHAQIAGKQKASHGGVGRRLGKGFCEDLYRRIAGISLAAARQMSAELMAFAQLHGAEAMVVENLKGWKPKGKGKVQRKRFHRFQHRALVKHLGFKCEEFGLKLIEVLARGTSYFAYDGSGPVKRDKTNATLATFSNGRHYNADLNAAYNIAARGLLKLLDVALPGAAGLESPERTGQNSGRSSRIPTVLADLWARCAQKNAVA
jgi:IS605 OrfB family transposase